MDPNASKRWYSPADLDVLASERNLDQLPVVKKYGNWRRLL